MSLIVLCQPQGSMPSLPLAHAQQNQEELASCQMLSFYQESYNVREKPNKKIKNTVICS